MPGSTEAANVLGVRITHPDKLLWPADGISKRVLAEYYAWIAPVLLRYAAQRPLTLRPFPRGIDQPGFYLKDRPKAAPAWIKSFPDVAASTGETVDFILAEDARTLVWLAQFNSIEVHPWLSRVDKPDFPDWAVIDLDPFEGTPWDHLTLAAHTARECLDAHGLQGFAKLTGSSGIHVLVPLARTHSFDVVRGFFERLAKEMCDRHPDVLTTDYTTRQRGGRILVDYAQNARGKTTVAPYSVRPKPGAPVAAPVRWEELDEPGMNSRRWTLRTMRERLDTVGDILEPALALRQELPR